VRIALQLHNESGELMPMAIWVPKPVPAAFRKLARIEMSKKFTHPQDGGFVPVQSH
jgi:hypothetical protein